MMHLKLIRKIVWCLIGVLGAWLLFNLNGHLGSADNIPEPVFKITQPFVMQTQNGKSFTEKDLAGKPSMMFFGFTHCPAICPGAIADMTLWLEKLGPDASRINPVFVSVDPERDTPQRLKEFLGSFDNRIIGLTGTSQQVAQMAKAYGIYYKKMPEMDGGDYMIDHSASIYVYDVNRQLISTIDATENRDIAFAKIKKVIADNP